jgi:large subunit ribosomal protein L29
MKQGEIEQLSLSELKDKIAEAQQQLSKLVFNHTVSSIENPMLIRHTRRGIARLKTEQTKRTSQEVTA